MKQILLAIFAFAGLNFAYASDEGIVISHDSLQTFVMNDNRLVGVSTKGTGAKEIEVWHSSIAPGSCTPLHKHDVEEVTIFIKGEGKAIIGDKEIYFKAPCTLILPAGINHQIHNTGLEPTDHFAILTIDSKVYNKDEKEMHLPWR